LAIRLQLQRLSLRLTNRLWHNRLHHHHRLLQGNPQKQVHFPRQLRQQQKNRRLSLSRNLPRLHSLSLRLQ
jgi:hypothetical protein